MIPQSELATVYQRLWTDFPFFCQTVLKIRKKVREGATEGGRIRWKFNNVQNWLWANQGDDDEILKMRAAGVSTHEQALTLWDALRRKNTNCVMIVDRDDLATEFYKVIREFYSDVVDFYRNELGIEPPTLRKDNDDDGLWWANDTTSEGEGLNSRVVIFSAKSGGAGLGMVIDRLTLSEIGRYEEATNPDRLFDRINQSLPDQGGFKVKESASYGGNYWRDLFRSNNGAKKIFISWVANEGYRVELSQAEAQFTLSGSKDSTWSDEIAYVPHLRRELAYWYPQFFGEAESNPEQIFALEHEVRCRLAYRRWCIRKKCRNSWQTFAQQYPVTQEEAFLSAGNYAFPQGKLRVIAEHLDSKPYPSKRYEFQKTYDLTERQWWLRRIVPSDTGDIWIYELPRLQYTYILALDPSLGVPERDEASLRVWRLPDCVEVLCYDKVTDPFELADLAYGIGQWYGNCLMGVEIGGGHSVIRRLIESGQYYPNPYPNLFVTKFSLNRTDPIFRHGFDTNRDTKRNLMVPDLREAIENNLVIFTHPKTVEQLRNYVRAADGGYSCGKKQDNAVVSAMIALQMAKAVGDNYDDPTEHREAPPRRGFTVAQAMQAMRRGTRAPII